MFKFFSFIIVVVACLIVLGSLGINVDVSVDKRKINNTVNDVRTKNLSKGKEPVTADSLWTFAKAFVGELAKNHQKEQERDRKFINDLIEKYKDHPDNRPIRESWEKNGTRAWGATITPIKNTEQGLIMDNSLDISRSERKENGSGRLHLKNTAKEGRRYNEN